MIQLNDAIKNAVRDVTTRHEESVNEGSVVNEGEFKVDDLVYNKRTKTVGIVRIGDDKYGEVKTDADGNVSVDELEKYNPIKFKHQSKAKVAPSTEKEVTSRGLFNPFKNESVVTEGVMSDIHLMAQEASTIEEFTKDFMTDYGDKFAGASKPKLDKWIADLYTDAKSMSENKMNTKTESIVKRLKEDSEYQKFFQATMKMFGVKSPKELSDKKKKEFFNYVDKNYKAKSEGNITETYFPAHAEDSAELKKAKAALANWFKNIKSGNVSMRSKVQQLDVLSDLIDDYAYEYAQDWASGNMN